MLEYKTPKADLRAKYQRVIEVSLILVLGLLIVAFKFFPDFDKQEVQLDDAQEIIQTEEITHTKQENRPPPPPKPPTPVEATSSADLDDIEFADTEFDENETVNTPPPPPQNDGGSRKEIMEEEPTFFVAVEEMPEPIGGIGGIQSKIVYPEIAKRAGVEGKVYILAFVDENGNVSKAEVVKGIGAGCDEAAVAAVLQTKFKPGKQHGKAVKVQMSIPVVFKLQ